MIWASAVNQYDIIIVIFFFFFRFCSDKMDERKLQTSESPTSHLIGTNREKLIKC